MAEGGNLQELARYALSAGSVLNSEDENNSNGNSGDDNAINVCITVDIGLNHLFVIAFEEFLKYPRI